MNTTIKETLQKMLSDFMAASNNNPETIFAFNELIINTVKDVTNEYIDTNLTTVDFDSPLGEDIKWALKDIKDKYKIVKYNWKGRIGYRGITTIYFTNERDAGVFVSVLPTLQNSEGYHLADNQTMQNLTVYAKKKVLAQ